MLKYKKILFPTDFSANADEALRHAVRLAGLGRGEIIVQHVVSDYFDQLWSSVVDLRDLKESMDWYVRGKMDQIAPSQGDVVFRQVVSKGKPAEEIAALAGDEGVDLIVMGSAGGAVTSKVIRLSHQPVLAISTPAANCGETLGALKTILVASDLSTYSARVIEYAFELKQLSGARLYLLHVIETPERIALESRAVDRMKEWARQKLASLAPIAGLNDPSIVRLVETGPISDAIAAVAQGIHADITIVGTHEYGAVRETMGTTTDALLSKSLSPVLAVKL